MDNFRAGMLSNQSTSSRPVPSRATVYMLLAHPGSSKPRVHGSVIFVVAVAALLLELVFLPSRAFSHPRKQDQAPQALGSLSKIGEVYVNDQPVTAAES